MSEQALIEKLHHLALDLKDGSPSERMISLILLTTVVSHETGRLPALAQACAAWMEPELLAYASQPSPPPEDIPLL